MLSGALLFACYFFLNKNSKLKEDNKILNSNIKEIEIETEKIITIQAEQNKIASSPTLSRERIHSWLRSIETDADM